MSHPSLWIPTASWWLQIKVKISCKGYKLRPSQLFSQLSFLTCPLCTFLSTILNVLPVLNLNSTELSTSLGMHPWWPGDTASQNVLQRPGPPSFPHLFHIHPRILHKPAQMSPPLEASKAVGAHRVFPKNREYPLSPLCKPSSQSRVGRFPIHVHCMGKWVVKTNVQWPPTTAPHC